MHSRALIQLEFNKVLAHLARLAVSEPGADACLAVAPMEDPAELFRAQELLRQARACAQETGLRSRAFPSLEGVLRYLGQAHRVLDADGLWAVREALDAAHALREHFSGSQDPVRWQLLAETALEAPWPQRLHQALKRCLARDGGLRDEASPELFSVRQEIRRIHQRCTSQVKDFVSKEGLTVYLQDDFMTISSDRYVLPLKTNFKGRVQGIIHDYSQTGETCYVEPLFLVEVNNRLQELKREEREEEQKVLAFLTDLARQEEDALRAAYSLAVEFDVLLAKAELASLLDGHAPEVGGEGSVELFAARHPLLALADPRKARPVDILLKPEQRALIISGANAAGKTVCLKTLGLTALMALAGLPAACREGSRIPFWSAVHVFMGDEQSLEDHLSTFTAQISHLSAVWGELGSHCLVLLDEFGAGTDPAQGAALAQAVVDKLLEKGAFAAAATHFPALKAYGLTKPGARSASMLFDPSSKKPLYVLAYDQVGASVALDVARDCGLDDAVLEQAQKYLLLGGEDSGRLFERLNELALEREREIQTLAKEKLKLEERRRKLAETFEKERGRLLEELRQQARVILRQAEQEKIGRKQALKDLAETRRAVESLGREEAAVQAPAAPAWSWEDALPGARVRLKGWDKAGVVREKDDKRRALKVDMGGVSLWAAFEDVSPQAAASAPPAAAKPRAASAQTQEAGRQEAPSGPSGPAMVVDLRGLRADAALSELGSALDKAILRGVGSLEVVHGRGTGALRREVHAFLKDFPAVASFALANEERGGDGMTMVELK
ncbi:Endonuclease MutS2 [Fundidesulfovibrio magnetotacticus]|uniref:Endonuclease MutS2 n=1 Tax=Fundidesulfovibrio magnetotacticus TaxID=2730080 RepID=A0A6V8LR64_9BACT|nr:Smr/MutS family protein [Fundidesulfovibrio magnetotacticus]GFK92256.1 Endonuclease MutS2 [Fundidesulfovibrio magnetotacticus]